MKRKIQKIFVLVLSIVLSYGCLQRIDNSKENKGGEIIGIYFDQVPPDTIPKIFAPSIVSLPNRNESSGMYSSDGNYFYFRANDSIYFMSFKDNKWTLPKVADFLANEGEGKYFQFAKDGKTLIYNHDKDLYRCNFQNGQWTKPVKMPNQINSDEFECGASIADDQSIYYTSHREGTKGQCDIFYSQFKSGTYLEPINLTNLNTCGSECGVLISPNDDFMLFTGFERADGYGYADIYLSVKTDSNEWDDPIHLGANINTEHNEVPCSFSPDGKYLFFARNKKMGSENHIDIYWVSMKEIYTVIDKMKNGN